jgi:serine/threonine protein kinase
MVEEKGMRLGKYELGRTLGEGNFGKVKLARNVETGHYFAVKIIEKKKVIELKITDQVSRALSLSLSSNFLPSLIDQWVFKISAVFNFSS